MKHILESLRPAQWIKNLGIFAAAILNGQLLDPEIFLKSTIAFIAFCFLSSSSYLINDIVDLPKDKLHPDKKNRPIARGDVTPQVALLVSFILFISGLALAVSVNTSFFVVSLTFIVLQYLYTFFFKKKAIVDIIGIALFFIIRAYAGELASGYHLPIWILLSVIFLSLFIASGKRRSELVSSGVKTRQSLEGYGKQLLNFYATMFAVSTLICYALFTFFVESVNFEGVIHSFLLNNFPNALDRKWYMITLFPVIFGIMRYGQIIFDMREGERPEKVIATDIPLLFSVVSWGIMMITLVYVF